MRDDFVYREGENSLKEKRRKVRLAKNMVKAEEEE